MTVRHRFTVWVEASRDDVAIGAAECIDALEKVAESMRVGVSVRHDGFENIVDFEGADYARLR